VTGTARSGSNLLARMLSANGDAMVACDPFFPLFPSLRNVIILSSPDPRLRSSFDPSSPLDDYYFSDEHLRIMDAIQAGDLHRPFDPRDWDRVREAVVDRMKHECADLVPHLDGMLGGTYKQIFDNGLAMIAKGRDAQNRAWVGFKEVWIVEFFGVLARAYPEARFIVLLRDPRAVIASMQAMDRLDASQTAHTLSYARHWRKYVAFARQYGGDPGLCNRLMVVTYERLVTEPHKTARELCDFLEVEFNGEMLDPGRYVDYSTGGTWRGNSSFAPTLSKISDEQRERWRTHIEPRALRLVEFVCGPEMRLVGYEPVTDANSTDPGPEVLDYMIENGRQPCSWRSDLGDPQLDYGFELFRRSLLAADGRRLDAGLIRRSFLFDRVFWELRGEPSVS
jgi:hypothetical protein